MMIVMFIIAMITGGLAYRYVGSLDESRAFKTKVAMERLSGILNLKLADDPEFISSLNTWESVVEGSPLVNNSKDIKNDGWGNKFNVETDREGNILVTSRKYTDYINTQKQTMFSNKGSKQ
ncbi:MAG: general secretion pathway protein GspG [Parachlamydiaceae bacterium]|nr:general secretion pathway protein GspG [Parachlamydiaceae bacterium]